MPKKSKVFITADSPLFLGEYDGIGQRRVDPVHVHELAENFHLWKDKPLLLWEDRKGASYVIGGQHRMKALREFVLPALNTSKLQMEALTYTAADVPRGMDDRDYLLALIQADNAGRENPTFDIAQLDHRKPWYCITKSHGIEFGSGGNSKNLQTEGIIRAATIARNYRATGIVRPMKWLETYMEDDNSNESEMLVRYARWWDEQVAMPASGTSAKINMNKPACMSLLFAIVLDTENGLPSNPESLQVSKAKQRTLLEAPTKLLGVSLYDRTKGSDYAGVWTRTLEPINAMKKTIGRLYANGAEKWI